MLLAIDIGNTNVTVGAFQEEKLLELWRLATDKKKTVDEYGTTLLNCIQHMKPQSGESNSSRSSGASNVPELREGAVEGTSTLGSSGVPAGTRSSVEGIALASVVPSLCPVFEQVSRKYFKMTPFVLTPRTPVGLELKVDHPDEVGADRILNALAAYRIYGGPAVVIDFGTATTFDCVSAKAEYLGGAILLGPKMMARALSEYTAQLPEVEIKKTERVMGKNTEECIQAGLFYGYLGMVEKVLEGTLREMEGASTLGASGSPAGTR
ncbi:MAG: type III pantothenate kinase, partial [Elusimicrobia bacterium]|nr:type III pantothenate kinase [Elusimicrobiota bacterium]